MKLNRPFAAALLGSYLFLSPLNANADDRSEREALIGGFATTSGILGFLGSVLLMIGMHRNEPGPDDPATEATRDAIVASAAGTFGLGVVMGAAALGAALDRPKVTLAPRSNGAVLQVTLRF